MTSGESVWQLRVLSDVAAPIPNAIVDGPFGSNLKVEDYRSTGVPVLQGKNITNNHYRFIDIRYISTSKAEQLKRSSVRIGDILLVKIGSIGYSALVDDLAGAPYAIIPANLAKVTPDPLKVETNYLLHWLKSPAARDYLIRVASKTAQPALSLTKIKQLPIPLPSIDEQRRIAAILDKAEVLRTKRRQALGLLQSLAEAIFIQTFGDVVNNAKKWPRKAIGDLLVEKPIYGTMIPPGGTGNWLSLRVANIQEWRIDLSSRKFVSLSGEQVTRFALIDGDVLLARAIASIDHLGKCICVETCGQNWTFDSHLMRLRFDDNQVLPKYVTTLLQTVGGRSLFLRVTRRSAVQFNVNTAEMKSLQIPVPPISLQEEFLTKTRVIARKLDAHQQAHRNSDTLFASLQHRAFRGEL